MKKLLLVVFVLFLGLFIVSCKKKDIVDPKNRIEETLEEEINEKCKEIERLGRAQLT